MYDVYGFRQQIVLFIISYLFFYLLKTSNQQYLHCDDSIDLATRVPTWLLLFVVDQKNKE